MIRGLAVAVVLGLVGICLAYIASDAVRSRRGVDCEVCGGPGGPECDACWSAADALAERRADR